MIVVDLEMSGLNIEKCGIWQIGAVDMINPSNVFFEDSRIDDADKIEPEALVITGKTEAELRDKSKQSQKQLLERFFNWAKKITPLIMICQHPQADFAFLENKAWKYSVEFPFSHRVFDLHSFTQAKYAQLHGRFSISNGVSGMGLRNTLEFCGMVDPRKEHNALEDAKLTAECFSRIVYGRNFLPEYAQFKIPDYLLKKSRKSEFSDSSLQEV